MNSVCWWMAISMEESLNSDMQRKDYAMSFVIFLLLSFYLVMHGRDCWSFNEVVLHNQSMFISGLMIMLLCWYETWARSLYLSILKCHCSGIFDFLIRITISCALVGSGVWIVQYSSLWFRIYIYIWSRAEAEKISVDQIQVTIQRFFFSREEICSFICVLQMSCRYQMSRASGEDVTTWITWWDG